MSLSADTIVETETRSNGSSSNSSIKYFIPHRCNQTNQEVKPCLRTTFPGCVCFLNGTCEYKTGSNYCTLCNEKNVVSYNEGEQCPEIGNHDLTVCRHISKPRTCPIMLRHTIKSCVCTDSKNCTNEDTTACIACNNNKTVAVLSQGDCSLLISSAQYSQSYEDSNMTAPGHSPNSSLVCQNNPNAHICTDAERNAHVCGEYLVEFGCVCYSNGQCKSQPTNRCQLCMNKDVISVTEGTNCTDSCDSI